MIDINLKYYIESMENNLKKLKKYFAKEAYENDEEIGIIKDRYLVI